jgi:hypothetical protein
MKLTTDIGVDTAGAAAFKLINYVRAIGREFPGAGSLKRSRFSLPAGGEVSEAYAGGQKGFDRWIGGGINRAKSIGVLGINLN